MIPFVDPRSVSMAYHVAPRLREGALFMYPRASSNLCKALLKSARYCGRFIFQYDCCDQVTLRRCRIDRIFATAADEW